MTSKRQQGLQYRIKTLQFLVHVGYASTRQIARAVWGQCDESTRKMASRTLRWLLGEGYISERRDDVNSERLVGLTRAGVNLV